MTDIFKHQNRKGERVGNDGLTDRERSAFAAHYRQTVCAPVTQQELTDARLLREAKRRIAADTGGRHSLDDVAVELGIDPSGSV